MQLTSPLFSHNGTFPIIHTCDGGDTNPPLDINGVPDKAMSLALVLHDPDAPGGTFVHWVVWNIDPKTKRIEDDSVPEGAVQGSTTNKKNTYFGPCPPSGSHRYIFTLYALDAKIYLNSGATAEQLYAAMNGHILEKTGLMAKYR